MMGDKGWVLEPRPLVSATTGHSWDLLATRKEARGALGLESR